MPTPADGGNAPISLDVIPRAGGPSVFQTTNVNLASGVQVCKPATAATPCAAGTPGLDEGRYDASWLLSSAHHGDPTAIDTSLLDTRFVIQQSAVGPTGPARCRLGPGDGRRWPKEREPRQSQRRGPTGANGNTARWPDRRHERAD